MEADREQPLFVEEAKVGYQVLRRAEAFLLGGCVFVRGRRLLGGTRRAGGKDERERTSNAPEVTLAIYGLTPLGRVWMRTTRGRVTMRETTRRNRVGMRRISSDCTTKRSFSPSRMRVTMP